MGIVYGVVIGLILDCIVGTIMGINAVGLGLVGLLAGIFDKNFSKDSRITIMFMVFGMTILFEILSYIASALILHTNVEILNFIRILVIEVIYNLIITIIIYPFMQRFGYDIENEYKKDKILTRYF